MQTGTLSPFPDKAQGPAPTETLIIHHCSDLHRGRSAGGRHALDLYSQRLRYLPAERQPNLLIVTGDLTVAGTRDELHEAAYALRHITMQWEELALRQHVFVVPGPHDIDWSATGGQSLEAFKQEFGAFCLPHFPGRDGMPLPGPEPYAQSFGGHYIVYLMNTCWTPESLPRPMPKPLEELIKRYRELWKDYIKAVARPNAAFDPALRQQFLQTTDALIPNDGGVIQPGDVERFSAAMQSLHLEEAPMGMSYPGDDQSNPLRILVTHHPLIAAIGRDGRPFASIANGGLLLPTLRRSGFQMALHGHTHEPHFLSDLPIESFGTSNDMPLLQIGAGTLGGGLHESNTFNEIVATRSRSTGKWAIAMTTVNLDTEHDRPPMRIMLNNPIGDVTDLRPTRVEANSAVTRIDFAHRQRIIQRQFVDALEDDAQIIPLRPLDSVKDAIKEVVFHGIETRVSLALKQRNPTTGKIELVNTYILPDAQYDDQFLHPYSYPDTVAAWAVIQGDPLIFPRMFREQDALVNFEWLQHTGKYEIIIKLLRDLGNTGRHPQRARDILAKLETRTLKFSDIFQDWLPAAVQTRFQSFAAIPIPLKSTIARQREIGVLLVDVVDPDPKDPAAVFTEERIDMLKTLSHIIDSILTTADKFRHPRGSWHIA